MEKKYYSRQEDLVDSPNYTPPAPSFSPSLSIQESMKERIKYMEDKFTSLTINCEFNDKCFFEGLEYILNKTCEGLEAYDLNVKKDCYTPTYEKLKKAYYEAKKSKGYS